MEAHFPLNVESSIRSDFTLMQMSICKYGRGGVFHMIIGKRKTQKRQCCKKNPRHHCTTHAYHDVLPTEKKKLQVLTNAANKTSHSKASIQSSMPEESMVVTSSVFQPIPSLAFSPTQLFKLKSRAYSAV
jgi:hypothetical protein